MKRPANDENNATSMKALVYQGPGCRAWEDRPKPTIMEATDAIVRITTTTICGTDLHILKGDVPTVTNGRILGHEGVGMIEELGTNVFSFLAVKRVVAQTERDLDAAARTGSAEQEAR